jgi:hypothetical protein
MGSPTLVQFDPARLDQHCKASLNGIFVKDFTNLLMCQGIYEETEERVSSYMRGVSW